MNDLNIKKLKTKRFKLFLKHLKRFDDLLKLKEVKVLRFRLTHSVIRFSFPSSFWDGNYSTKQDTCQGVFAKKLKDF